MNKKDLNQFVSKSTTKTPPMKVQVIDANGKTSYVYDAPAGFQLERYVSSLFPKHELMVSINNTDCTVSVGQNNKLIEIHRGVYQTETVPKNVTFH